MKKSLHEMKHQISFLTSKTHYQTKIDENMEKITILNTSTSTILEDVFFGGQ